jgi:hypothetical protein
MYIGGRTVESKIVRKGTITAKITRDGNRIRDELRLEVRIPRKCDGISTSMDHDATKISQAVPGAHLNRSTTLLVASVGCSRWVLDFSFKTSSWDSLLVLAVLLIIGGVSRVFSLR